MPPSLSAALGPPPVILRDGRFAVLDKPAGLPAHPSRAGGPSVEDWFPALRRGARDGPWLAHRLDRDTAGCLVVALRKRALLEAQAAFAEGRAEKTYWAVVQGCPPGEGGTVHAALSKRTDRTGWRMAVDPAGQRARTRWRVIGRGEDLAWLELHPLTGRTHQVRAHCAYLGCPVLGDPVYGTPGPPLHLLARAIRLPLLPPLEAQAAPPPHMLPTLRRLGFDG